MAASCIRALFWTLGLASLALSAAVTGDNMNDAAEPAANAPPLRTAPSCNLFYRVRDGETCWDIITQNEKNVNMKQFRCWNPDINPTCSNLIAGRNVCVGVENPGPAC